MRLQEDGRAEPAAEPAAQSAAAEPAAEPAAAEPAAKATAEPTALSPTAEPAAGAARAPSAAAAHARGLRRERRRLRVRPPRQLRVDGRRCLPRRLAHDDERGADGRLALGVLHLLQRAADVQRLLL